MAVRPALLKVLYAIQQRVLIKHLAVRHAIQHASISRKHMVIEVSPVKPGDGVRYPLTITMSASANSAQSHIYTKSEITIHDQNSKCGTTVDGESIQGGNKKLTGEEHIIKLGRYQHGLR